MVKRILTLGLALLAFISLPANAWWGKPDITMLVVPREAKPIRIAQDIARQYPVLLVTYRTVPDGTEIHAWNGESWVAIEAGAYAEGSFFQNAPSHAIMVEAENKPAPEQLIPSGAWCPAGNRLASTDPRVMIHLLGRYFDFPYTTWNRFAQRYGYTMEEVNPGLTNVHWFHYRGDVLLNKLAQRNLDADLDKWYLLNIIPPPQPAEPEEEEIEQTEQIEQAPDAEVQEETDDEAVEAKKEAELKPEDVTDEPEVKAESKEAAKDKKAEVKIEEDPFSGKEIPEAEVILPNGKE